MLAEVKEDKQTLILKEIGRGNYEFLFLFRRLIKSIYINRCKSILFIALVSFITHTKLLGGNR